MKLTVLWLIRNLKQQSGEREMVCLIKVSEFIKRVYGGDGATPPAPQTITRSCRLGQLPAEQKGKLWYIDWDRYQAQVGDDLVYKVLQD